VSRVKHHCSTSRVSAVKAGCNACLGGLPIAGKIMKYNMFLVKTTTWGHNAVYRVTSRDRDNFQKIFGENFFGIPTGTPSAT
jgi:hypothetical protein